MHLPRHTIESHAAIPLFRHASFCTPDPTGVSATSASRDVTPGGDASSCADALAQPALFSCASLNGFMVSQTDPLKLVCNRTWSSSQGGLSHAVPVQHTSLLFLVGGGRVPRFSPNKVILWDEAAEYTAKPPANATREVDSDDDDDADFAASRRASTVFSAGSQFETYGEAPSEDDESFSQTRSDHASSHPSTQDLRFSASSLVEAVDIELPSSSTDSEDLARSDAIQNDLEHSFVASSLGIGRLQSSHCLDGTKSTGLPSMPSEDTWANANDSFQPHSVMSSSADLADPFAQEEIHSADVKHPNAGPSPLTQASHSSNLRLAGKPSSLQDEAKAATGLGGSPQGLFSHPMRQTSAGLVDSVSSMATTATDATAKAEPKILHGRPVAELEFSQVVRGIYVTSVHAKTGKQRKEGLHGKGRALNESASTRKARSEQFCVVLVVLLESKAVVFELSPPSIAPSLGGNSAISTWRIQKRTAVQTYKNPKGLGSVAPHYGESAATTVDLASVIVAIPGRQKGHVQLLDIPLQSLSTADTGTPLSNPMSSLGAAHIIVAHESSLAAITLSPNGRFVATASSKGTLIRIWSNNVVAGVESGLNGGRASLRGLRSNAPGRTGVGARLIRELRRGTDPATISSIAFSSDASLIAAASDKGTIHIFLLDVTSIITSSNAGRPERSSSSSSSRTANLGRAAAQYLPSSMGNLAGQVPSSVLPQYLKSEWSGAQFRIPLKSFGSSSRHYNAPSATEEGGLYGEGARSAKPFGTEKSTEGAWAQMRSRISDLRKGEASVEESIFLCWILEARSSSTRLAVPTTSQGAGADKDRSLKDEPRSRVTSSKFDHNAEVAQTDHQQHRLIALTTSGGWYKLAVSLPDVKAETGASSSTVLDMYRRDSSSQSRRTNALLCELVEYRPMAALLDGWRL